MRRVRRKLGCKRLAFIMIFLKFTVLKIEFCIIA